MAERLQIYGRSAVAEIFFDEVLYFHGAWCHRSVPRANVLGGQMQCFFDEVLCFEPTFGGLLLGLLQHAINAGGRAVE